MRIVEAKHSDINLKKSYNVVKNQYLSGDVYDFNAPRYEQDDTYTTVDANGFIMDKQGNKYPVKGSHNTEDAGRIVGGASRTIVKIYYGEEVLRWEHYLGVFSSYNDGNGGIFASLEQGIYLEDFCAKFPNGDPRKLIAQIAEGGSKDALTQRDQGVVDRKNRYFSIAEGATTFLVKDGKISTVEGRSYKTNHWSYGGAVKEDERYKELTPEQISVVIKNIDDSLNVNGYNLYDFDGAIIKVLPKSYSYNHGVFDSKTGDFRSSYGFEDVVDGTYGDWNKYKKYVNNKGFKREKSEYDKLVISEINIKNTPFYDQICEIVKKSRKLGRREFIDKKIKNRGWRDSIAKAREGAISEYDDETNLLLRGNLPWNMFVEAIEQLPAKVVDRLSGEDKTPTVIAKNSSDRDYAKMTAWHNGERRENIKACSPEKLIMYRNICTKLGYQEQVDLINTELSSRGINESVKSENLIDTEYSHTKDIAKDKEYFKNKYEKKGYKNVCVKKVKSDTKGLPMYEIYGDKEVNESLNESNDEDMGYKLGKWLGARLLTGWTAMLNVDGAEESPYYDEYDQQFDGNFAQCLKKLKEYQNIIDRDGIDAYLALQSSHDEYFDGDYDNIIDKLYDRGYLYDDDLEESFNVSDETIEDAIEYYRENAFGFDGLKNYVETDFSHLPKEARDEIYKKMKKKLGESLNENCNSYSYKGKIIIDASGYWFVKGYEEKFPTSDEAEEFVDDMKKDEGLEDKFRGPKPLASFDDVLKAKKNREKLYYYEDGVGNDDNPIPVVIAGRPNKFQIPLARLGVDEPYTFTIMDFRNLSRDKAGSLDKLANESLRINIRESLNKMDAESDNTYDLLNLYESKNLSRKQKKDIARMIYENYGLERIYNYLYEATEESEDELPVEDRIKELTNDFKNTNGSYVFEEVQDANKAVTILKSRGYEASQKRTQDGKYRVTAQKKNNNK